MYLIAYFSRKLTSAERNYDGGNRELLAVKLALEEWRHWLEEATQPFLVLTDCKSLEYLRKPKRLNPRQASWALFFTRFNNILSCHPGSKNDKADTLFQINAKETIPQKEETILPKSCWINTIEREFDHEIENSPSHQVPGECPSNKQYVPPKQRNKLITWAQTTPGSGHPGTLHTLELIKEKYWWPAISKEINDFIASCPTCA